jgi:hypothetical protein
MREEQRVLFPAGVRDICLLQNAENGPGTPLPIYPNNGEISALR